MEQNSIAAYMWKHVNSCEDKPMQITLNQLEKEGTAMMIQPLSGSIIEKKFIDDSFIGMFPFSIYVRVAAQDTSKRLNAIQLLYDLNDWLIKTELPYIGDNRKALKIYMNTLPSIAAGYENGDEDYQAIFHLKYNEKKG